MRWRLFTLGACIGAVLNERARRAGVD